MSLKTSNKGIFKKGKTISKKYRSVIGRDEILFENYIPDNTIISYESYFFRKDIIHEYTKKLNQKYESVGKESPLKNDYEIYNLDDIILNILRRTGMKTRKFYEIMESLQWIKIINYVNLLFSLILSDKCSENVNKSYIIETINEQFNSILNSDKSNPNYDNDLAIIIEKNPSYTSQFIPEFETESDEDIPENYEEDIPDIYDEEFTSSKSESYVYEMPTEILKDKEFKLKHKILDEITNEFREININFGTHEEQLESILNKSVAFINVVRSDCMIYKNDYVLSLICSKPGFGSILLGLYLYSLLTHPIIPLDGSDAINDYNLKLTGKANINYRFVKKPKSFKKKYKYEYKYGVRIYSEKFKTNDDLIPTNGMAILEIANAYANYAGLCAYQKFGFEYDKELFSNDDDNECMISSRNLPMSINFREESNINCYSGLTIREKKDKVLNIVCGINENPCQKHRICSEINESMKKYISRLNNLIVYQDSIMSFDNSFNKRISLKKVIEDIGTFYGNILKIINKIKPADMINYDYIVQLLNSPVDDPNFIMFINEYRSSKSAISGGNKLTRKNKKIKSRLKSKKYLNKNKNKN